MAPNSVANLSSDTRTLSNAALNWYIKETGIDWTSPFAGLLIKGAGSSKADRHPLNDDQVEELKAVFEDDPITNALFVVLRDTGARVADSCRPPKGHFRLINLDEGYINITTHPHGDASRMRPRSALCHSRLRLQKSYQALHYRQRSGSTCLRTLCPTKRYGPIKYQP